MGRFKYIREKIGRVTCPKCGKPGIMYVKTPVVDRENLRYVYVAHSVKADGKWTSRYCYVGPEPIVQNIVQKVDTSKDAVPPGGSGHCTKLIVQKPKEPKTHCTKHCTKNRDIVQIARQLPGYKSKGYTTLGDMKRLGLIISDWSPEKLDEWEEEGLTRVKEYLKERVGTVYYHCVCGEKIDQVDLFLKYRGKCPKCGKQIMKRERIEKVKGRKKCRDCEFFVPAKGLDVGVCRKTGKTKHESEFCDSDIPGLIPSKIETSPQEALLNRFFLEARKKLTKGQTYQKHK